RTFADICESARNSNDNPKDFWRYQVEDIGKERRKTFSAFCEKLELDPQKDDDLATAFDYLKRTHIELFPDDHNTFSDLLTKAGFILTGEPKSAISILTTYANNNDMYRKPICVDQLWRHLKEKHGIHPKRLEHDSRISPAIEDLQNQFFESINPGLINRKIISREETTRIIDAIDNGQDVVVHGAAGNGKSGVLYELAEHLRQKNVPFLPIRLDRRVPGNTAKQFGQDLGLPDSPAHCLVGLAEGRKSVLILDQLDAIRWTASHSSTAMCVCKELLRQTRSFRKDKKQIVIVFACRTFDLENDPDIKNLFAENSENVVVKVPVAAFSDEQLKDVIGPDAFVPLNGHQKRVLSCPHNLAIWLEIKKE
ncbi:AAA family ATPase, partial [Thiolapillus sp.]|uniref:AAA family ATPase n=1 Tax=Thiolapillus sp. TaxID=2017437 RepID=UPI003AF59F7F